jgi:DNA-binding NtrC family response regulator
MKGFTPDAEQAMLLYDWPGNISEMRQCIIDAMDKTGKDWLTPVDLGLFKGITADGAPFLPEPDPFLVMAEETTEHGDTYVASALEALDVALGEAIFNLLTLKSIKPFGAWADDEVVLATLDRYGDDGRRAADFLHTKPRNISRWHPKIQERDAERNTTSVWQKPRRLIREWIRESPQLEESPLSIVQALLLAHVEKQCATINAANRARIIGVSMPTYLKRLREIESS